MSPQRGRGGGAAELGPLARLREDPARAAILTDVDGTLAPIVGRPEEAAVPARASEALRRLAGRYALVACISGRRAAEVQGMVRVDGIAYSGNHGLELLLPGEEEAQPAPALAGHERDAAEFVAGLPGDAFAGGELRLEDKGPIQALHWRGAGDEVAAEARAREIAAAAEGEGLAVHWGRKVLELRPTVPIGKDAAIDALLGTPDPPAARSAFVELSPTNAERAVYAGDDRTDLDAFRRLRELERQGELETAVCVGVASDEGPAEIAAEADLTVDGPSGWLALLEMLAE